MNVKPIGARVLVKVTAKMKPKGQIITSFDEKDPANWLVSYKILAIGEGCPQGVVKVRDVPVFDAHCDPTRNAVPVKVETKLIISHAIIYYDDIIGVETK